MSQPKRKKKFVDPKVQGSLVRRLVLHWLIFNKTQTGGSLPERRDGSPMEDFRQIKEVGNSRCVLLNIEQGQGVLNNEVQK